MEPTDQPPADDEVSPEAASVLLGRKLRELRTGRGLVLRQFAKEAGFTAHSNFVDYEQGRRVPPPDIVRAYESICGSAPEALRPLHEAALKERGLTATGETAAPSAPEAQPGADTEVAATEPGSDTDEPAVSSDAGVSDGQPPAPKHRSRWAAVAVLPILGLAVAGYLILGSDGSEADDAAPPTTAPSTRVRAIQAADGSDPMVTGCSKDATIADKLNVYFPDEHLVGELQLRLSAACGMGWGRFSPTVALSTTPPVTVSIEVHRPADGKVAPYQVTHDGQPAYGNMLQNDHQCIYALVALKRGSEESARFSTRCLMAED